jgi:DNA-binding MarR family transcriptional regulator/predicted GNAT family acetyltransferase
MSTLLGDVRRFNRTVTEHIGVLSDHFLGRGLNPNEARLLWEIGPSGSELRSLRAKLDLDSGYLTRLVRSLGDAGLVSVVPSPADRRIRLARLTRKGITERARLDERSDEFARGLLDPLTEDQQRELVDAMRTVQRLLAAATVEIRQVDPEHPDARRCLAAYYAELDARSGVHFDPTTGSTAEPAEVRPPHGVFVVAYLRGTAMGCGALKHHEGGISDIKRMWVHDGARGRGVGRRLLEALERRAIEHGDSVVRLETSALLGEAISLYRSAGYVEVDPFNDEPFADHWFSKTL